jgi:hypothetical protein
MTKRLEIDVSGPLFAAGNSDLPADFLEEFETEYGKEGVRRVRANLKVKLKNPTGKYSRGIRTDRSSGTNVVTDNRAVYGPWLEGTSSRNRTTRFKGYRTFRLTTQQLDRDAQRYADNLWKTRYQDRVS